MESDALRTGMMVAIFEALLQVPPSWHVRQQTSSAPEREAERWTMSLNTLIFQASGPPYISERRYGRSWNVHSQGSGPSLSQGI